MSKRTMMMILIFGLVLIGSSGCLRLFQPVNQDRREFNFVDMQATTRLARPVKAELLAKKDGKWVSIGVGVVPAGAFIRGQAPKDTLPK